MTTPNLTDFINDMSPALLAEFIAAAQERLRAEAAATLPAKVAEAIAESEAKEAESSQLQGEERAAHADWVLVAFTFKGVDIPALDMSEVTNLDEVVSGTLKSPYNKARYRNGDGVLVDGNDEFGIKVKRATYGFIASEHDRLLKLALTGPAEPVKVTEVAEVAKVEVLVADLDPRVKALMTALNLTETEATERLASL